MKAFKPIPLVALAIMIGCGQIAYADGPIKIGLVMPMTGALASNGKQVVAGAKLYMREHGDMVGGRKVEILLRDDGTMPEASKRLAQELIVNDKVDIIGAGITPGAFAMAPLVSQTKTPTVVMLSGSSSVTGKSPYMVHTSFKVIDSATVMATWALAHGTTTVVTLVSDFVPGVEAEDAFKAAFVGGGVRVVEALRVPLQGPDFSPFLQRVRDTSPQAVFVFLPAGQGGVFARQFAERGLDKSGIQLIGPGDVTDDDVLPTMGDTVIGAVTAHFYSAAHKSAVNQAFVAAFEKANGYRPNFMAVSGYDGMQLIYRALEKTGGVATSDVLMAAMKGQSWESPRGPMSIDPDTREMINHIYMRKVEKVDGGLYNVEFETLDQPRHVQ